MTMGNCASKKLITKHMVVNPFIFRPIEWTPVTFCNEILRVTPVYPSILNTTPSNIQPTLSPLPRPNSFTTVG